jgi:predicted ribosome quality control (RQC) complex YloA/Tae2 family protein
MDNFLLQAIVNEFEALLVRARLGKVYQIGATDLAIDPGLRDGRWLMVSTDPQRLALYLSARNPKKSGEELRSDTPFVSLVKKLLGGARIATIENLGYDRVVSFEFEAGLEADDEEGRVRRRRLIVLLTGRGADVLALEDDRVVARLREREDATDVYAEPSPPADRFDPFDCSAARLDDLIAGCDGDIAEAAQKQLIGYSPLYARELAHRAGSSSPHAALRSLLDDLFEAAPHPAIYSCAPLEELKQEVGREEFSLIISPIELGHLASQHISRFDGVNEAADAGFALLDGRRKFLALKQKLNSQLSSHLKKRRALAANLRRELKGFANAELHQRYGELLLANLHQVEKQGGSFLVVDFYDESQAKIEIPSAEKATAQEAAEHYFKLARKARHGIEAINQRLPQIDEEIAQTERRVAELAAITCAEEMDEFAARSKLPESPQRKAKTFSQSGRKPKEEKISGVRRYRSHDGYEILVGRADRDNDNLTFRIAKSFDLWFHTADYPGSHVVLRNPQRKQVPQRAIIEAAQLAAKFSQARADSRVAVNYCERKFVTKMKGFAPGQVRLSSFKTVLVEPGEPAERIG